MPNGDHDEPVEEGFFVFLEGEAQPGSPVYERREFQGVGDDGSGEAKIMRLRYANACGHTIHVYQMIGGGCSICGRVLCSECAKDAMCAVCGHCTCRSCQILVRVRGEEQRVCKNCRWRAWFGDPWDVIRWVAVVIAVLILAALL